jgi:RNA polymerase sigma-70 factor (ECF subfamily)
MSQALTYPASAITRDPDAELVAAAQQSSESFSLLYERYLPRVYRYLSARVAAEDAADLMQAVFLKAFDALPGFKGKAGSTSFAAWLFRIARNAVIDAHRRRRPATGLDVTQVTGVVSSVEGPESAVLRSERLQRLRLLVAGLDPAKRDLLALRFAAGLSSREIGGLVGKNEAAVKKQLSRIIAQLKESYTDEPE